MSNVMALVNANCPTWMKFTVISVHCTKKNIVAYSSSQMWTVSHYSIFDGAVMKL